MKQSSGADRVRPTAVAPTTKAAADSSKVIADGNDAGEPGAEGATLGDTANPISQDFLIGSARAGIERIRARLLDLTNRNRLLNFRPSARSTLQIVGALPDALFQRLGDGDSLTFKAVPEPQVTGGSRPTAGEHAQQLGIPTSPDLPLPSTLPVLRTRPGHVQTLHYANDLESILRRISYAARTAIEESGTNMLYLVFGFLEWYESDDSAETRLAPLLVVPVAISRGKLDPASGTFLYEVAYAAGEDIEPNLCLREKVKRDFGLELPDFAEDDTPETYFSKFRGILNAKRRWRLRRQITLALLYFGKLRMYRDLDARNWPPNANLLEHALIKDLFEGTKREDLPFSKEYEIDSLPVKLVPPLVLDADSSQHSVLIDALKRKNLVVQGPPGTGKSQTISNLIGIAMAEGKTVLFVSEKLAALEVVRRRLDECGLGIFCLELHSHKTEKRRLLDDLDCRIKALQSFSDPRDLDGKIRLLNEAKRQLTDYVELINSPCGFLGRSVFEVIWARERLRQEVPFDPSLVENRVTILNARKMSSADLETDCQHLEIYGRHLAEILRGRNSLREHPWYGVNNFKLDYAGQQELVEKLAGLRETARALHEALKSLNQLGDLRVEPTVGAVAALANLTSELPHCEELPPAELLQALVDTGNRDCVRRFSKEVTVWWQERRALEAYFSQVPDTNPNALGNVIARCERAVDQGFGSRTLEEIRNQMNEAETLAGRVERVLSFSSEALRVLACDVACEMTALRDLAAAITLLEQTPPDLLSMREAGFEEESTALVLNKAGSEAGWLHGERTRLSNIFELNCEPSVEELDAHVSALERARFVKRLGRKYRKAKRYFKQLSRNGAPRPRQEMASALKALRDFHKKLKLFEADPNYRSVLGVRFAGVDTDFVALGSLVEWYKRVREALPPGRPSAKALMLSLFRSPGHQLEALTKLSDAQKQVRQELDALVSEDPGRLTGILLSPAPTARQDLAQVLIELRRMARFAGELLDALARIHGREDCKISDLTKALERFRTHEKKRQELECHPASGILGNRFASVKTDVATIDACLNLVSQLNVSKLPAQLKQWILQADIAQRLRIARKEFDRLTDCLTAFRAAEATFRDSAKLANSQWYGETTGHIDLAVIEERSSRALDHTGCLSEWIDFLSSRDRIELDGLLALGELAESRTIQISHLIPACRVAFYSTLLRAAFADRPELIHFTGLTQEAIRESFIRYDKEVIALNARRLAWRIDRLPPPGRRSGPVSQWTELALIENEISKRRRHIPIRQLVRRAGRALQTLKPCFMMSPLSVAQYLAPGQLRFDIVVMDEASQLKPEDALGAIARSSQLIVVGDPKQLPPSTFFERRLDGPDDEPTEEDETLSIEEQESILDVAWQLYERHQLKWHYRSRHESLIAFSNHRFYQDRLVVFPSPFRDRRDLGVMFRHVANGVYEAQRNRPEAERVVTAVLNHMMSNFSDSLGVVALNFEQRELIEEIFTERTRHDEAAQRYLEHHLENGERFFIKNLENVQGDERDVIFISVTYGPDARGNLFRRFGPINQAQGPRRLNVLFTRAKRRVVVFSSIDPDQLRVDDIPHAEGVKTLKEYLTYAKTGALGETRDYTGSEPANDFEAAVGAALRERGLAVVHNFSVRGFLIDIAIRHPKKPGAFVLGVECDGATYHSLRSVRDRDRLRELILKNLGWTIHRIWSTDWFKNSKGEIDKLVARVEQLVSKDALLPELHGEDQSTQAKSDAGDEQMIRQKLIQLREDVLKREFPEVDPTHCLLRESMIEALLRLRPTTKEAWLKQIPDDLRNATHPEQVGKYLERVLEIIAEIA